MAGFGGAVKLTGESEYKKALSQITQSLKVVSAEMKATASSMESGDKSMKDTITASQNLKKALDEQKTALSALKSQLDAMQGEYTKNQKAHKALVDEYNSEKQKLDEIGKTLGTSSNEYKEQEKAVNKLSQEVTKSQKALDAEGKALDDMRIKTANAETTCNKTAKALDELGDEAVEAGKDAEKGGDGFTVMKGVLSDLASNVIQSAIDGIKRLGEGIVDIGKQSLELYAQNEQLVGGVETLFGESADQLMEYANTAYKTAGISANQYMEQATSFSASLLQGLGGDTEAAVQYANEAITDMSDNANKMGTSIESIQNAYQGFAKGNFTMLDNLKLGYGGTKEEMLRLVQDAGLVDESVESIDDVSFDKIIDAIHIIQQQMGITGTTAKEAEATIEGSTAAMKAAWENLLVGIASGDADISQLTGNLVDKVIAMGKNMIPRIKEIISGMGELVTAVWNEVIPQLAKEIPELQPIVDAMNWIKDNSDTIIAGLAGILAGFTAFKTVGFITGLVSSVQSLFGVIQSGVPIMQALNLTLSANPIGLVVAGIAALVAAFTVLWNKSDEFRAFWTGLWDGIKGAVSKAWEIISDFFTNTIPNALKKAKDDVEKWKNDLLAFFKQIPEKISEMVKNATEFLKKLPYNLGLIIGETLGKLIKFGSDAKTWVTTKIPEIISAIVTFFAELPSKLWNQLQNTLAKMAQFGIDAIAKAKEIGKNFVEGLVNFIKDLPNKVATWFTNTITKAGTFATDFAKKATEAAKNFATNIVEGIKEIPSKVGEVGKNIIEGLWNGMAGMLDWLKKKIKELAKGILDGMKSSLGIKSPSKVFRDEVGRYLAQGIGVGFTEEMSKVANQMQKSIPTRFDTDVSISRGAAMSYDMVAAFKEALYQVKIEMDDEQMGRFVDKTVTNLVFN